MSLILTQSKTALAVNLTASFLGVGGVAPYVYSVRAGGAGGTIDSATGVYTAPSVVNAGSYGPPKNLYDTVVVTDANSLMATSQILVGNPLLLFCEVIQKELGLANGRVYLWDQKIMQPTDAGLYVAIAVVNCKPFGNVNSYDGAGAGLVSKQVVNMYAQLQVDIISRDTEARDRKEEVILALGSDYAETQQEANSFLIGKLPPNSQFLNLSSVDGAAIPYRFTIGVAMQYFYTKPKDVGYFDTFQDVVVTTEP